MHWQTSIATTCLLFSFETYDIKDDEDNLVYDPDDDVLTAIDCCNADWDSNDETKKDRKPSVPPSIHVPAGSKEIETREQMLLRAAWHVKSACCQRFL